VHDDRNEQAADVREWLRDAGPRADQWRSTFGAGDAIRRALSRRRRHRFAMAGTAATAVLTLLTVPALTGWSPSRTPQAGPGAPTGSAPAATDRASSAPSLHVTNCGIVNLPVPSGLAARGVTQPARVFVTAMDGTGAYVVANAFAADNSAAAVILWHDKAPTVLPTSGLGAIMSTMAVNSHGVVAGTGESPGAKTFAWVYRDGVATKLPNVPGYPRLVQVYAVNEAGDVLGSALSDSGDHSVVVVWPATAPDHPQVQAALTDKLGPGIGGAYAGDGQLYAWDESASTPSVWTRDGHQHALTLPDGLDAGGILTVRGGWAYGIAYPASRPSVVKPGDVDPTVVMRWRLDGGASERVVGRVMETVDTLMPAFTRDGGGYVALSDAANKERFVLAGDGGTATPVAISDDATLVAGSVGTVDSHEMAGNTRPVLWRC
jgi:hypothetical protein